MENKRKVSTWHDVRCGKCGETARGRTHSRPVSVDGAIETEEVEEVDCIRCGLHWE